MYSDFGALIQEEFAELIVNATPTTDFTPSKSKLAVLECNSHCDECMTFVGMGTSIVSLTWIAIVLVGYTVHNTRNLRDKFLQLWRENRRNFEILKRMTAAEYMDDETKAKITAVMADLQSGKTLTEESKDKLAKENEFRGSTRSVPKVVSGSNSFNSKNSAEDEVRNVAAKVNADLITVAETDDIDLHEVIGQGSQGVVYRGIFRNEKDFIEVAVKQLLPKAFDETNIMRFHDEIKLMSTIRHPNIIRMVGCSFDPIRLCMLLEFAAKGSLAALLKSTVGLNEWMGRKIVFTRGIAHGMSYLHNMSPLIVHRDLKLENILVMDVRARAPCFFPPPPHPPCSPSPLPQDFSVKISDFGEACRLDQARSNFDVLTTVGTPWYVAPENFRGDYYDEKTDV